MFSAIVGVPANLVSPAKLNGLDFEDVATRDKHYDALLRAPELIEKLDPDRMPGNENLLPSCKRSHPGLTGMSLAYPPRRFIQLAKAMGESSRIQSICQDDLRPAVDTILNAMAPLLVGGVEQGPVKDAEPPPPMDASVGQCDLVKCVSAGVDGDGGSCSIVCTATVGSHDYKLQCDETGTCECLMDGATKGSFKNPPDQCGYPDDTDKYRDSYTVGCEFPCP